MDKYKFQLMNYKVFNRNVKAGGAVFFGCDSLSTIPVCEIMQGMNLGINTYNRSIKGPTIENACNVVNECIYQLSPSKLFVNIGENDIDNEAFDIEDFIEKYEWFLYNVHRNCQCSIYIMSIRGKGDEIINSRLRELASNCGCEFFEINDEDLSLNFIRKTKCFLRGGTITFSDAMAAL